MSQTALGVLVMAYGTPKSLEDVESYYTHIRRGKPPTPELLEELINRYRAIGGVSPLNEITRSQGEGILHVLNQDGGRPVKLYFGMKHSNPFIDEAVEKMAGDGIKEAVSIVLAPHYSAFSVGSYQSQALEAGKKHGIEILPVMDWHMQPRFLALLASRVKEACALVPQENTLVLFTAHSLPERIVALNDPYPQQLRESGDAVAKELGLNPYEFGWQSAGRTPEPWLGPDVLDVLKEAPTRGFKHVVICPQGFVSDHLEVLYDIDIECQDVAKEIGISLVRTRSLNADPEFVRALAEVIRAREAEGIEV